MLKDQVNCANESAFAMKYSETKLKSINRDFLFSYQNYCLNKVVFDKLNINYDNVVLNFAWQVLQDYGYHPICLKTMIEALPYPK